VNNPYILFSIDRKQIFISDVGVKCRALAYNTDGSHLAIATLDGKVLVLSNNLSSTVAKVTLTTQVELFTITTFCNPCLTAFLEQWTQVIAYSPDGHLLAVGAHDSVIYILETKSYSLKVAVYCYCMDFFNQFLAFFFVV